VGAWACELEHWTRVANSLEIRSPYAQETVNQRGIEPILPLVNDIQHILGPILVSESEPIDELAEWDNTYAEDYEIPAHLKLDPSVRTFGHHSRQVGPSKKTLVARSAQETFDEQDSSKPSARQDVLTQALAYTHSRGEYCPTTHEHRALTNASGVGALLSFAIEGDAGGENPQVQELYMYQTGGGLPSKV